MASSLSLFGVQGGIPLYREEKLTMIVSPDGSLEENSEVEGKTSKMAIEMSCVKFAYQCA